jgi:Putative beta-barrel porin 2
MPRSLRATVGCFFVLSLTFTRLVSSQTATSETLTTPPSASGSTRQSVITQAAPVSPESRRLHYQLRLDLRGVYDDNISLSSQNKISDYYARLDPALSLGFGDVEPGGVNYLKFEYDPDFVFFAAHSQFNSYQHVFVLGGQSNFSRLTLGLSENAQLLKGFDVSQALSTGAFVNSVNLDVRGRPELKVFNTQVTANYDLSSKTSLNAAGQSTINDYAQFTSSQILSGNLFLNYIFGSKLTAGIGGTGGRQFIDQAGQDQTFEQINIRATYVLTGKLVANGSVGLEFREFDSNSGIHTSPVFQVDLSYTPTDASIFTLSGSRNITSSASSFGQDFTSTTLIASGRQRFFQRFFLRLTGGYENLSYFGTTSGSGSSRNDNYYFLEPGIDAKITRYLYVGGYFLHRRDDSSVSILSFDENQVGVRATLTF